MNAPPRRIVAPAALTASAVSNSCSLLSTEHGPAMTVSDPSPMTASRTRITVSSGWNSRETSLYGRLIGVTDATPGRRANCSRRAGRREPISPTTAMTVRSSPTWSNGVKPSARIRLLTPRISASLAPTVITTNIALVSPQSVGRPNKKAEVWPLLRLPDTTRAPGPSDRERSCRASKIEIGVHVRSRTVSIAALAVNEGGRRRDRQGRAR